MIEKQASSDCHKEHCSGKATPRDLRGIYNMIHFDCDKGHKYHTDHSKTYVMPCDCKGFET